MISFIKLNTTLRPPHHGRLVGCGEGGVEEACGVEEQCTPRHLLPPHTGGAGGEQVEGGGSGGGEWGSGGRRVEEHGDQTTLGSRKSWVLWTWITWKCAPSRRSPRRGRGRRRGEKRRRRRRGDVVVRRRSHTEGENTKRRGEVAPPGREHFY